MARNRKRSRETGLNLAPARRASVPQSPRARFDPVRAINEASAALGSVLHRQGDKPLRRHPDRGQPNRPALDVAKGEARRPEPEPKREPLRMEPLRPETCKGKPSERQSRSGSGGSRPFVPWCDRR